MSTEVATVQPQGVVLPSTSHELMTLCRDLAMARSIPAVFQRSPADLFLAINMLRGRGLDPFMALSECSVIKGRLFFSGKLSAAIINQSGLLAERLSYSYSGEGENRTVTVTARLKNENEPRSLDVRLKDVRTENEQWVKQPDQQLAYSGARNWGRRFTPDILMGAMFEGETIIDVTPPTIVERATPGAANDNAPRPQAPVAENDNTPPEIARPAEPPPHDPETGETGPRNIPVPPDTINGWREWAQQLVAYVRAERDIDGVDEWLVRNEAALVHLRDTAPKMYRHLEHAIETHKLNLAGTQDETGPTIIGAG